MKKISPFFRRIAAAVLVFAALQGALQATAFAEPPTVSDGAQPASPADGEKKPALTLDAKSVILMDAATGTVLYESNADEALPPASVTKIMTLLLVMEAVDGGKITMDDSVRVSDFAAGMGGSQVFLSPGEEMTVREMLKCVTVASANDAAVALAEYVSGSADAFVARMNERAGELGMKNTHFENPTGLDDNTQNHLTSARDIAIMSRELLTHPGILEFTGIWMDTVRNGSFGLTNTNRLIRFYQGANGLKTGSTGKAKFCISATALRDGMQLIAVVMGSSTRDARNETAKTLLDYGFAGYSLYRAEEQTPEPLPVKGGTAEQCPLKAENFTALLGKGEHKKVEAQTELPESLTAPVEKGTVVGKYKYLLDGKVIGEQEIVAAEDVERLGFGDVFRKLLQHFFIL